MSVKSRTDSVWTFRDSTPRKGLINDGATGSFCTNKLDFAEASNRLMDDNLFQEGCGSVDGQGHQGSERNAQGNQTKDWLGCAGHRRIQATQQSPAHYALSEFVEAGEILDRGEMTTAMRKILNLGKGNFGIVFGGVSTGKSFMLKRMAKERFSILRLDGRDLTRSMYEALGSLSYDHSLDTRQRRDEGCPVDVRDVINAFVEQHAGEELAPCIIIDEANAAFEVKTSDEKERAVSMLWCLIQLSKQDKRLNVLLALSDHSELHRLRNLGVKDVVFTDKIFASEVPPQIMLRKLGELGFRDNLAGALVAVYGGHVWTLAQAVSTMTISSRFSPLRHLSNKAPADISACLRTAEASEKQDAGMGGMRELLQQLATEGFAPLVEADDPRARLLFEKDIAEIVYRGSVTIGIPADAWGDSINGLVPSTQSTRLIIAHLLNQLPTKN